MANSFSKGTVKVYTIPRGELHKFLNETIGDLQPGETIDISVATPENDPGVIVIMVNWNS